MLRMSIWILSLLLVGCASQPKANDFAQVEGASQTPVALDLDANLARLSEWFGGEWDNYEQVVASKGQDDATALHERIHSMFLPVSVPAIGGSVFFARQTLDDDPSRLFRLRLYRFVVDTDNTGIRLDQFSFNNEKSWRDAHLAPERLSALTAADLRFAPDCAVYFSFDSAKEEFVGSTREGACKVASERLAKAVTVEDRIQIGADKLWILSTARDQSGRLIYGNARGVPHKQRKVRYFTGWIAINKAGMTAKQEDRGFRTMSKLVLHSEGRSVPITWEDGRRTGYSVQIARLSFQGDSVHVLALKLLDDATGQPAAYSWADPNSRRIGINVQWFQSDFVEIEGDSRFAPRL